MIAVANGAASLATISDINSRVIADSDHKQKTREAANLAGFVFHS